MSNDRIISVDELAEIFGALSNPNRLRLLLTLLRCCPPGTGQEGCCSGVTGTAPSEGACVGDLSGGLDIAPSTVSHHLKELRRVGLISSSRSGQTVLCCVNEPVLACVSEFLVGVLRR